MEANTANTTDIATDRAQADFLAQYRGLVAEAGQLPRLISEARHNLELPLVDRLLSRQRAVLHELEALRPECRRMLAARIVEFEERAEQAQASADEARVEPLRISEEIRALRARRLAGRLLELEDGQREGGDQ